MINKELKFNFYQIPFGDLSLVQKSKMHHARNESSYVAQKLPKFVAISRGMELGTVRNSIYNRLGSKRFWSQFNSFSQLCPCPVFGLSIPSATQSQRNADYSNAIGPQCPLIANRIKPSNIIMPFALKS